jgi:hypothetical protein
MAIEYSSVALVGCIQTRVYKTSGLSSVVVVRSEYMLLEASNADLASFNKVRENKKSVWNGPCLDRLCER